MTSGYGFDRSRAEQSQNSYDAYERQKAARDKWVADEVVHHRPRIQNAESLIPTLEPLITSILTDLVSAEAMPHSSPSGSIDVRYSSPHSSSNWSKDSLEHRVESLLRQAIESGLGYVQLELDIATWTIADYIPRHSRAGGSQWITKAQVGLIAQITYKVSEGNSALDVFLRVNLMNSRISRRNVRHLVATLEQQTGLPCHDPGPQGLMEMFFGR